tara:strand:- start:2331 stop:3392 length:1062 start_codon:yes stop_codon:yes gene_type:complete
MKISFLLPHVHLAGGVKALLEYANRLLDRGHETTVFIPASRPKWHQFGKKRELEQSGIKPVEAASIDWFSNHVPIFEIPEFTNQHLPDADILVVSSWQTAEAGALLASIKGKKYYFIQHYEALWTKQKLKADATYTKPFCKIVISSWLRQILKYKFEQETRLLVTPVNRDQFYCEQKIWNEPPKICLLHHDYDWKGYAHGIAAVQNLRKKNIESRLIVFGEKLKDPKPLFQTAGFDFEYHYRPTGEMLRKIYSASDIYLCPSWHEGLGMPAMEAMACRCALVTTDTGGCRDYAIQGQTALVSAARDVAALTENLDKMTNDVELRDRLSENGYQKILEFNWDSNVDQLEKWFTI